MSLLKLVGTVIVSAYAVKASKQLKGFNFKRKSLATMKLEIEQQSASAEFVIAHPVIEGRVINVCYNPLLQAQLMGAYNTVACWLTNRTVILVDENFYRLSDIAKEFTIEHEIGHIIDEVLLTKSDLELRELALDRARLMEEGKVCPFELRADAYAASVIGKEQAIKALTELRKRVPSNCRKEFSLRIQALKDSSN